MTRDQRLAAIAAAVTRQKVAATSPTKPQPTATKRKKPSGPKDTTPAGKARTALSRKARAIARAAAGLCLDCPGQAAEGRRRCTECQTRHTAAIAALRAARNAAGICTFCTAPATSGKLCERHRAIQTEKNRARGSRAGDGRQPDVVG